MLTYIDATAFSLPFDPSQASTVVAAIPPASSRMGRAVEATMRRDGRFSPAWAETLGAFGDRGDDRRPGGPVVPAGPEVRVNLGGDRGERIRSVLALRGAVPSRTRPGETFAFASEEDRSEALGAIRSRFGWTTVDPL